MSSAWRSMRSTVGPLEGGRLPRRWSPGQRVPQVCEGSQRLAGVGQERGGEAEEHQRRGRVPSHRAVAAHAPPGDDTGPPPGRSRRVQARCRWRGARELRGGSGRRERRSRRAPCPPRSSLPCSGRGARRDGGRCRRQACEAGRMSIGSLPPRALIACPSRRAAGHVQQIVGVAEAGIRNVRAVDLRGRPAIGSRASAVGDRKMQGA